MRIKGDCSVLVGDTFLGGSHLAPFEDQHHVEVKPDAKKHETLSWFMENGGPAWRWRKIDLMSCFCSKNTWAGAWDQSQRSRNTKQSWFQQTQRTEPNNSRETCAQNVGPHQKIIEHLIWHHRSEAKIDEKHHGSDLSVSRISQIVRTNAFLEVYSTQKVLFLINNLSADVLDEKKRDTVPIYWDCVPSKNQ